MARYQKPPDPRQDNPLANSKTKREPIPWLWVALSFFVTLLSIWAAVWLVSLFLAREPLAVGQQPATIIRLTAPATAEPSPTSLLPTPTGIPTLTPPPPLNRAEAPATVTIGFFAQVINTDGIGVSIRAGASTVNEILTVAPEGSVLLILDGPIENSGFNWWQVKMADGTTGFAVERFLEPAAEPLDWPGN